jgi:ferrous iron transport protein A
VPADAHGGDPPAAVVALDALAAGVPATVVSVALLDSYGDRLAELGLTPGASLTVLRKGWMGGPLLLQVRDYVLSLRRVQAAAVRVRPAGGGARPGSDSQRGAAGQVGGP